MSTLTQSKPFDKRRIYSRVSEIEVYYRRQVEFHEMVKVSSSDDAADYFRDQWGKRKIDHVEQFMVIYLNRSNRIMGWSRISLGGQSGTVVDPKIIFQIALKANAASIIMAHNHPSGNSKPSDNDLELTKRLVRAGKFLDLQLLDHIILTSETYFSFANENLIG
ncbi:MAG: JAB domain-containing protein [Bacteroidetes bacterium]|nr:JAB domain-containing protein [Bacteroidota bacterium]